MSALTATGASAPVIRSRSGHTSVVGAMLMATAGLVAMMSLGVFYIALRFGADAKFASQTGMKFNNYSAVPIATGFGLAVLFDLAALNLVWDIGQKLNVGVKDFPATTIVYTLLVAGGIAMVIGAASCVAGLVSVLGGHSNPSTRYQALAASIGQHFAGLAWLIPFVAIFLKK
jgi:hypothetical protein